MSKTGRRIRTAEENKKKEFRKMIEFLILGALMIGFLVVELSYQFPEYAQLQPYNGEYHALESRRSGRRKNRAFGLVLEDGSSFYIHKDFDREAFQTNVDYGEELSILADADYKSIFIRTDEPVVYEITSEKGDVLRSYDDALEYLRRDRRFKASTLCAAILVSAAAAFASFWNWRKYRRMLQEYRERKTA